MRTIFIYYNPHRIHESWANSVTKESYPFVPKWLFDFKATLRPGIKGLFSKITGSIPFLIYPISIIKGFFLPRADVYLVESLSCVPAVYFKKGKVIMINDDIVFYLLQEKGFKQKFMKFFLKRVDAIISSSNLVQNYAKKFTKVPNKIVYPFVDTKKYIKKANIKSKNICFSGVIEKQKRPDLIIEAHKKVGEGKIVFIGKQGEFKVPKNDNIIVTGWTSNPENYLQNCGIYINPAEREAFGMAVMEAMIMGIPPLVSNKCGVAEIVKKVDKRLIVELDSDDIAKKISWLNSDIKEKQNISKKCIKVAMQYNEKKSQQNFKKTFMEILR